MSLRGQISEMPGEKQIAWLLRLIITAAVAAGGTISWGALQKLDRIAETQAGQTARIQQVLDGGQKEGARLDLLYELHYAHGERIRALELRSQWDRRPDAETDAR